MDQQRPSLDPKINEELKRILEKSDLELTKDDKAFLRARKPYIGKQSRKRLAWLFKEEAEPTKPENPTYDAKKEDKNAPHNEHPADEEARKAAEKEEAELEEEVEDPKKKQSKKDKKDDIEEDLEDDEEDEDAELE